MFPGVAMVSDPLTDGWYLCTRKLVGPMHIVCPNCSTSYAIEEASLGAAGRTVRCARCKTTWFASAHQPVPEMATAEDADAFTGVIRPDQTNASNEAPDLPPEASEHEAAAIQDDPAPPTAEIPVVFDAPSPVPSIESPAHPDAAADSDEIENFAARRKRLQARRRQARTAQQCGRCNGAFRQRPGRHTRGEVRPAPVHMRPALSDLGSEILQQPLDVIELKLRPEAFAEPLAQLLENTSCPLSIDLTGHFDRQVVTIVATAHGSTERIGVLLGARLSPAGPSIGAWPHALLLHRLRQSLGPFAHGIECSALAVHRAVSIALA
jgi:predicted Zn finger-like uncharacterized protein